MQSSDGLEVSPTSSTNRRCSPTFTKSLDMTLRHGGEQTVPPVPSPAGLSGEPRRSVEIRTQSESHVLHSAGEGTGGTLLALQTLHHMPVKVRMRNPGLRA